MTKRTGGKGMPRHVDEIFLDTSGPQNNLRTSHPMELKERSVGRSRDVHRHFRRRPPVQPSVAARFSGRSFRNARRQVRSKKRVQLKTRALWRHAVKVKGRNPLPRFSRVSRLLRLWSSRPAQMRWNHANVWRGSLFKACEQQTRPNIPMVKFYIDMM